MLKEKVLNTIFKNELIKYGDTIVIGVSGGPDSITLLHLLETLKEELKINIVVCHVNHGLRENAKLDQKYVEEYCQKTDIPCYVKKEDVKGYPQKNKIGTEQAGREIRYAFFEEIAKKINANRIATAHTANDNVETMFLNLFRGTGVNGLKGIEPIRNGRYIRPLIDCTREEIENYCQENELQPRIDETNLENEYQRNKIRNELIPYVQKEFNPNIIETMNRLSDLATEETAYVDKVTANRYQEMVVQEQKGIEIILDLKSFNREQPFLQKQILRYTITSLLGSSQGIEKKHLEDILVLCRRNIGNKFLIPNKRVKILVKNKKIFFQSEPKLP